MDLKFGTSGLRGLSVDMTADRLRAYTSAFIATCDIGQALYVGQDLRESSPRIAQEVIAAAQACGVHVVDCGQIPTPGLALAAGEARAGAIMITGSHIPADRNGLKFYTRHGEITKTDEVAILAHLEPDAPLPTGEATTDNRAAETRAGFIARYTESFGARALAGRRIGVFAHSAVGRDVLHDILTALGATTVDLGRSDHFIPIDTEAVAAELRDQISKWVTDHGLDALVSTDGDSDRPLLADDTGAIIPGDILGQITADWLQADTVVTPVSSNSGVMQKSFGQVIRTRIGSPFVISAMQEAGGRVAGYEANGGFLLGFTAAGPAGDIAPLMTRDCILPILTVLVAAGEGPVSARVRQEPAIVTAADRLQDIPQEKSQPLVTRLAEEAAARAAFLAPLQVTEAATDLTDGVRITLQDGAVLHIRPSGNAPELRVYTEANDATAAHDLLARALRHVAQLTGAQPS